MKKLNFRIFLIPLFYLFIFLYSCEGTVPSDPGPSGINLKVRVLDKVTFQPIYNARVSLKNGENTVGSERLTDQNGEVLFPAIAEGDGYIAYVNNAKGYKSSASPMIKVVQGAESNVLLDRIGNGEGSGLIAGSAKDKDSKLPIEKLTIMCTGNNINKSVFTDENGSFLVEGLSPGTYIVTFVKAGYAQAKKQVVVKDGIPSNIETVFLQRQSGAGVTGNYLVSLSGQRKVAEMDKTGKIIWSYSNLGSVESALRVNTGETLIADGSSSKIVQVSPNSSVKTLGNEFALSTFRYPSWVDSVDGNSIIVTDNGSNKIMEFVNGKSTWSYSTGLLRPRSAVYLSNGNILISDTGNRRVLEINKQGNIIWSFDEYMDKPVHAIRLSNGNTLITDSGLSRVLEVNFRRQVIWWFAGSSASAGNSSNQGNFLGFPSDVTKDDEEPVSSDDGLGDLPSASSVSNNNYGAYAQEEPISEPGNNLLFPRSATKNTNGNVVIADTGNNRIIEVSRDKKIVSEINNLARPVSVERL
jgi:hypothetical protein